MHNSNQQNHEHYPEEIDLVDVAAVVYRRKATLVLVVLCSVIVSFGYWFYLGEKIEVSAVFETGEILQSNEYESHKVPLMSATDSSQLLTLVYLPALITSTELETGTQIDVENIEIKYLESAAGAKTTTSILELFADSTQKEAQASVAIFDGSFELLLKRHEDKLAEYRLRIRSLIDNQKNRVLLMKQIATLEDPNTLLAERSLVESNILSLESTLAASTNSVVIKSASVEQMDSKGAVIYVAGGVVSGLFLGCFLIFFLELYAKAKIRAAETA